MNMTNLEVSPCFYRISVKALVLDETRTKFLIVKEEKGVWELPGGGLDWGTTPQEDLAREIKEEMGLETAWVAEHPSYFFTCKNRRGMWIANLLYETKLSSLDFTPSDECIETAFTASSDIESFNALENVRVFARQFDARRHQ